MSIETQWIVRKSYKSISNALVKDLYGRNDIDGLDVDELPWKERSGETIVISREIAMFKAKMMRTIEDITEGGTHRVTTTDEVIEEHHAS